MIINMHLTYDWWDKVNEGKKRAEYRQVSKWWKRMEKVKPGDFLKLYRGYTERTMLAEIEEIRIINGFDLPNAEYRFFHSPNETPFYEIKFKDPLKL